jgi:1-acyl-sn-glycerol-3-phosphate acyltransferase
MNLLLLLRTLFCYFLIGIGGLFLIVPCFIIACLPPSLRYNNRFFFWLLDRFYKWVMYASLTKITIQGKENLPPSPAIFVGNHQSAFDIPVMGSMCNGYPHVWLVLSYYLSTPVLGFFIARMFIPVDRDDPEKAAGSLRKVLRFVQEKNTHLIIFPEGMRHADGKIHTFYEGFAFIAKLTNRPIIPVYMPTTGKIYPIYSFFVYNYPLDVIIGKPMYVQEDETEAACTDRVHNWFVEADKNYRA